eukprot:scaffold5517_cov135-Cylindrotheca_fusiformis.AAC.26
MELTQPVARTNRAGGISAPRHQELKFSLKNRQARHFKKSGHKADSRPSVEHPFFLTNLQNVFSYGRTFFQTQN